MLLLNASTSGAVVVKGSNTKFSHDRQQYVAYKSIAKDKKASMHFKIANYFHASHMVDDYIFDGSCYFFFVCLRAGAHLSSCFTVVDNYLVARSFGRRMSDEKELVVLTCKAAHRANRSASSRISSSYLQAADSIAHFDQPEAWLTMRETCFFYAQTYAESSALSSSNHAVETLFKFREYCTNVAEELRIYTSVVRLYIALGDK